MQLKTRNRVKLIGDTFLFISFVLASLTGILKMPILSDSVSDELYHRYQGLPWETLTFLHDWCGALALACVVLHLALVWRRYLWRLKNVFKSED